MEQKIFQRTGTGQTVDYKGTILLVALATEGCAACVFESEGGAIGCKYRESCFADRRPDKMSVVFTEVK